MLEDADPEYIEIVKSYLEAQRLITTDENAMDCSLWRPPASDEEEFSLLGDGAIIFIGKYEKGKYQDIELDYGMTENEIFSTVEAKVIPLADPNSPDAFAIEDYDLLSVEPGGGIVIPYTVLCSVDLENHTYLLINEIEV